MKVSLTSWSRSRGSGQYISVDLDRTVFDEMQRAGWSSSRTVERSVTAYYRQGAGISDNLNERPAYRTLIRELIPHTLLDVLWEGCHDVVGGVESLSRDCVSENSTSELRATVDEIRKNPRVKLALDHWTSITDTMGPYMIGAMEAGQEAIAAIDAEVGQRQRRVLKSGKSRPNLAAHEWLLLAVSSRWPDLR